MWSAIVDIVFQKLCLLHVHVNVHGHVDQLTRKCESKQACKSLMKKNDRMCRDPKCASAHCYQCAPGELRE